MQDGDSSQAKLLTRGYFVSEAHGMKTLQIAIIFLFTSPLFAADFVLGHWQGQGFIESQSSAARVPIKMDVQIEQKLNFLNINDCWETDNGSRCYKSHYEIMYQGDVFENGVKIGDIFPQEIHIFIGNGQVTEQMILELNGKSQLLYHYTFLSDDGILTTRSGELMPQPN